jgi:hypothetical protein
MAKLAFGMNRLLDGYFDRTEMVTGPQLLRHWTEHVAAWPASYTTGR